MKNRYQNTNLMHVVNQISHSEESVCIGKKRSPPLPEIVDPKWLDLEEKLENVLKKNLAEEIARKNLEQELERVKKALEDKSERSPEMTPPLAT